MIFCDAMAFLDNFCRVGGKELKSKILISNHIRVFVLNYRFGVLIVSLAKAECLIQVVLKFIAIDKQGK